jgi:hypothetical protein
MALPENRGRAARRTDSAAASHRLPGGGVGVNIGL